MTRIANSKLTYIPFFLSPIANRLVVINNNKANLVQIKNFMLHLELV
jgi:hypothetical protein